MKYILIFFSALLMGLSQQPIGCGWFAWVALLPLIFFLDKQTAFKEKIYIAVLWGFTYHFSVIYWLFFNIGTTRILSLVALILATLILTVNTILIISLYHIVSKNRLNKAYYYLPVIWVVVEYVRTFSILGFPWVSLANSQVHYNLLAQNVEFTGIYGISFWVVLINVISYDFYKFKNYKILTGLFLVLFLPWISGYYLYNRQQIDNSEGINLVVVQPNIHLKEKRNPAFLNQNIKKMVQISLSKIDKDTDLILFPESSLSSYSLYNSFNLEFIQKSILNNKIALLTGLNYYESGENYNSIAHIDSENLKDIYHKINLVPLAEYMPLSSIFPSLKSINIGQANFEPGNQYKIFNINGYNIGGMICYESTFPQLNRHFILNGAEILIYFINDGWYETAPEPQQHAKQSIYRSIEFRRPVVRCANTGISQIIDKTGNITSRIDLNNSGAISANVIPSSGITFYAKYGDIFAIINILLLSILLGLYFKRK